MLINIEQYSSNIHPKQYFLYQYLIARSAIFIIVNKIILHIRYFTILYI